jgi:hypothetical protein
MDVKGYGVFTHIVYTFEHFISFNSNNSCNGSERGVKVKWLHLDGDRLTCSCFLNLRTSKETQKSLSS